MAIPIISVSQMREWENSTWAAGRTEAEVISRVGHIVALRARQLTRPGDLIVVLAGKGHNGDDARQASRNFSDREIYLINVTDPESAIREFQSQLSLQPALIVDGLFGIGLNRALAKPWIKFLEEINASGIAILSIDVPSGLNAETGQPEGAAIRASLTLTLGAPKKGLLAATAWKYVGRLEVAPDIGLVPNRPDSNWQWSVREDFVSYPPVRSVDGHKGTFGHAAIFGGSLGYHGASVLAVRGALRAQPGLVTLYTMPDVYVPVASQLQAAMVHPWRVGIELPETTSAILIGPGLASTNVPSEWKAEITRVWKESPLPVVVDASAIDWLPQGQIETSAVRVMTPHPGEAARVLKTTASAVQKNRPKALVDLSRRYGSCWVVLKGHQTLVGSVSRRLFVNSSGNPFLGQGGSGDVLAGYIVGLLAQPGLQGDPVTLLRYAVWQHGAAADALYVERRNWTVDDLLERLGSVTN